MKTQLIMSSEPILVSDEQLKENDNIYLFEGNTPSTKQGEIAKCVFPNTNSMSTIWKKIVAGIPELPQIDFTALSEEDSKKIGWVDVDGLWNKYVKQRLETMGNSQYWDIREARKNFINGFKTSQSLNEKKFTLDDIRKAIEFGTQVEFGNIQMNFKKYNTVEEQFVNTMLSQSKVFDVEIEMEPTSNFDEITSIGVFKPKIINNSIKILKVVL